MIRIFFLTTFLLSILHCTDGLAQKNKRVLVFSKTLRYYHESIPNGIAAIQKLGATNGFDVDTTKDASMFNEENLRKYSAVIFMSPGGNVFDTLQQADLERYIQAGGGYMGIHAASTVEYDWPWYGQMVGGVFNGHPEPQEGIVEVADANDASTKHLPTKWKRFDEWYNFRNQAKDIHVLLTVDETSYKDGKQGAYHPLAWYHEFDGGRSFYTALGHFGDAYEDPLFLQHLLAGIKYAMGDNVKLNYKKVSTKRIKL